MNIIWRNNLLPFDFQTFLGKAINSYCSRAVRAVTIASELLLRGPIRMLKGHFSIILKYHGISSIVSLISEYIT
jgi:hypothetical protein